MLNEIVERVLARLVDQTPQARLLPLHDQKAPSPIRGISERGAGHHRPELRLHTESERRVKRLRVVRLQADVLTRHLLHEVTHHG